MASNIFLIITLSVFYFNSVLCTESVPVLIWNKDSHKSVPALQHVGKKSFKDLVQSYIKEDPFVVVFDDENLSTEDFISRDTSGHNVFESLQKVIEDSGKMKLTYLPSVQSPIHVLRNLAKTKEIKLTASAIRSGDSKLPKPLSGHFLFIDLDEAEDDENRNHLLKRHAKFIAEVFQKLEKQYPNTIAIYTAKQPSWYEPSGLTRKSRHLLEAEITLQRPSDANEQHYSDDRIRIYIAETPYTMDKDGKKVEYDAVQFSSEQNESRIDVNLKQGDLASIVLSFTTAGGYWYLNNVTVGGDELKIKDVAAPTEFSYHCNDLKAGNPKVLQLVLPKVQFQPNFDEKTPTTKFGDAYDCVGFTSIPIWSGIFVTLILAMIMTLGLSMMMDIKTMDRFDDPKGKGVTINVVE